MAGTDLACSVTLLCARCAKLGTDGACGSYAHSGGVAQSAAGQAGDHSPRPSGLHALDPRP
eukprot:2980292-Rhodomonas_salina.1